MENSQQRLERYLREQYFAAIKDNRKAVINLEDAIKKERILKTSFLAAKNGLNGISKENETISPHANAVENIKIAKEIKKAAVDRMNLANQELKNLINLNSEQIDEILKTFEKKEVQPTLPIEQKIEIQTLEPRSTGGKRQTKYRTKCRPKRQTKRRRK